MRSDQEVLEQTNEIARIVYASHGYEVEEGYDFHSEKENRHPYERQSWVAACEIQLFMTESDVQVAIDNLEE